MLLHDGAMGTMLGAEIGSDETADDLCVRAPELVRAVHAAYLAAGVDVIQTNSFLVGLRDSTRRRRLLLDAAHDCAQSALSGTQSAAGRLTATIGPHGRDPRDYWFELEYWLERGVSLLRVETISSTAAIDVVERAWAEVGGGSAGAELLLGCTVAPSAGIDAGRWVAGVALDAAEDVHPGLNCCEGVAGLRPFLELMAEAAPGSIWVDPSAGLSPYLRPDAWAELVADLVDGLPLRAVGGCCGTTPEHIVELRETMEF